MSFNLILKYLIMMILISDLIKKYLCVWQLAFSCCLLAVTSLRYWNSELAQTCEVFFLYFIRGAVKLRQKGMVRGKER